jgi:cytochrome c oxidase cbb3-type subunit III
MSDLNVNQGSNVGHDDQLLDHAYDGIQEFDNPMPRWWIRIFWGSFLFSLAYMFHYWLGNGVSINDDFAAEMAVIDAARAKEAMSQTVSEETLAQVVRDAKSVSQGAEVFVARCVTCHLEKGQGSIGPNLTDNSWIHGKGQLMDIFNTVSEGVAAKGMPAWSRQLSPGELRQVVAYVGTLRGTNIPGKAPEGEVVP